MNSTEDQQNDITLPGLYSLHVEPECVVIRKERAPIVEAFMVYPFIAMLPIMGLAGVYVAVLAVTQTFSSSADCPLWLGFLMFLVFGAGAVICFVVFRGFSVAAFSGTHRIEESRHGLICRSWVLGIPWRRRRLERPLEVVAEVYPARGDWTTRVFLKDANKRRFHVVIPTAMGSSRAATRRKIKPFAEAFANALGCACVIG